MNFDQTRSLLRLAEDRIIGSRQNPVKEVAVVANDAYVSLKLLNPVDYSLARVFVNNERVFSFDEPVLQIPVNNGDFIILDTRGIKDALWFEVIDFSENVFSLKKGQQFRVKNGLETFSITLRDQKKY
ncbi:MAG: hypothetical protein MI862_22255 [Desulfobacterales bacterium]|nr:hypothetical protein [Desulfobacterales bacterium]